jgi:hypothetical protein
LFRGSISEKNSAFPPLSLLYLSPSASTPDAYLQVFVSRTTNFTQISQRHIQILSFPLQIRCSKKSTVGWFCSSSPAARVHCTVRHVRSNRPRLPSLSSLHGASSVAAYPPGEPGRRLLPVPTAGYFQSCSVRSHLCFSMVWPTVLSVGSLPAS